MSEKEDLETLRLIDVYCNEFSRKRVLDVGTDTSGHFIKLLSEYFNPKEVVGINLAVENKRFSPSCRIDYGDIRKTNYKDNYFDIIISSSAFEHINNFDIAITEMHRILKPGGFLYSHFGPIWSAKYGHHLWLNYQGKVYTYKDLILPPFCQLLMEPQDLFNYLANTLDPGLCEVIVEFIYYSSGQNRLFFEDYERIIKNSNFEIIFFKGYDGNSELNNKYLIYNFNMIAKALKNKFPDNRNFMYDGIHLLLEKN